MMPPVPYVAPSLIVWVLSLTNVSFRKRRLDEVCVDKFQQYSRTFIQSWILQGELYCLITKDRK